MDVTLLLALAAVAVVVAVVVTGRRRRDPLQRRFTLASSNTGWTRAPANEVQQHLLAVPAYARGDGGIDAALTTSVDEARLVVAAVGARGMSTGRPWYVAAVRDPRLRLPVAAMDPRSVRTVRLVAGQGEVVIGDSRIARGWRVTAEDPQAASELLDTPEVRDRLGDVLHRPVPWIVGLRFAPGFVSVHLAGPEESPSDADEVERLGRLALDVAEALRVTTPADQDA